MSITMLKYSTIKHWNVHLQSKQNLYPIINRCFPPTLASSNHSATYKQLKKGHAVVVHNFNSSTWETEADGSVSSRSPWATGYWLNLNQKQSSHLWYDAFNPALERNIRRKGQEQSKVWWRQYQSEVEVRVSAWASGWPLGFSDLQL